MQDVVIVAAQRTPSGSFGSAFVNVSAVELGKQLLVKTLEKLNLDPKQVDEVIFGNVLQAGLGQNVARQIALGAGVPIEKPSYIVNKLCGSGLKAVQLGAQAIMLGDAEIVVAGGTENMSQAPYLDKDTRWGKRMGDATLVDSLIADGLTDIFSNVHMGVTAENIADQYNITREQMDEFAVTSQNRAEAAVKSGKFVDEIIPIEIPQRKGDPVVVAQDESPRFGATYEGLTKLRPAFKKDGRVTAANSSTINDGAALVVLMSKKKAEAMGLKALATIKACSSAGVDPSIMGTGPIPATQKVLEKAGWKIEDLDLVEANEAFAAQCVAVARELQLPADKVNVNGGAIALGHPIGASGCRILVSLIYELRRRRETYGLATLCVGGGMGVATIVEAL